MTKSLTIAITGGAGFIGTQLAKLLKAQGHELILIDLKPSPAYPESTAIVDITDRDALTKTLKGVDVIYHLAAEHRDDVSPIQKYHDVNVDGGQNVIEAARAHDIQRIIFTSSVAVYPLIPADPQNGSAEIHPPAPFNPYGQSKLDSEKTYLEWVAQDTQRSLTIMRLVATFGVGNRGNIFNLINQIASGKFIMIGAGENKKSIAYVGNVAAFLAHTLHFGAGTHLYNYADKPDLTMRDFVTNVRKSLGRDGVGVRLPYLAGLAGGLVFDILAKLTGRTFPISLIRVRKFCANTIVNADKLDKTDFTAPYTLEQGLQEMIEAEFDVK